jgi:vacuolar-type H+-ATPase subunit F/Vma7
MLLTTALAFSASMATAAISPNDLVTAYQAQGFTKIEVTTGATQTKLEAVKGNAKVEVIYDTATGAILSQETKRVSRRDRGTVVEVSTSSDDFSTGSNDHASSDDGAGHDMNDDNGGDQIGDDSSDDDSSADDSSDDNHGDNQGKHGDKGKDGSDDHGKDD